MKIVLSNSFNSFLFSTATIKKLHAAGVLKAGEWYETIARTNPVLVKIAEKGKFENMGDVRVEEIPERLKYKVVTTCDGREEIKIL